jgi:hypothetical protein
MWLAVKMSYAYLSLSKYSTAESTKSPLTTLMYFQIHSLKSFDFVRHYVIKNYKCPYFHYKLLTHQAMFKIIITLFQRASGGKVQKPVANQITTTARSITKSCV